MSAPNFERKVCAARKKTSPIRKYVGTLSSNTRNVLKPRIRHEFKPALMLVGAVGGETRP